MSQERRLEAFFRTGRGFVTPSVSAEHARQGRLHPIKSYGWYTLAWADPLSHTLFVRVGWPAERRWFSPTTGGHAHKAMRAALRAGWRVVECYRALSPDSFDPLDPAGA